ncbi:MAG: superoxide dismutase [Bacteroidales bacterium]|nr:superoxide dismutase [Bacteroidales bacterium]
MSFELPLLPYAKDALEPVISEKTLEFHHGKHHQAYVTNLNKLLPGSEFENADLETIIKKGRGGIFNNGAQVWNHTFYFESFSPDPKKAPEGKLGALINRDFGSLNQFKGAFEKAAATIFGSGWAWLAMDENEKLTIVQASNADNPLRNGLKPLVTADVWEHAYYLDYQNKRPEYLGGFWNILDWQVIEGRL